MMFRSGLQLARTMAIKITDSEIVSPVEDSREDSQHDSEESDSGNPKIEVILHTEALVLHYIKQRSKTTSTDVIFMKHWWDIAASSIFPVLHQTKEAFDKIGY